MNIQEPSDHPLVKLVMNGKPDVTVMLLAGFTAVVVAPLCEEITFRLLLQGWLEKWEVKRLRWRSEPAEPLMSNDEAQMTNDEGILPDDSPCDIRHATLSSPPARGIGGWPFGWLPITISAILFGLAHFGYGPEPIPLFFLGLILGYLYQRTHRIVPSIVAHAIFNLFTMIVLWRMVFYNAQ